MSDERAFKDYFSGFADKYAAARPTYPEALYEFIASNAPARDRAWDCATGNGQAAVGLANVFSEVCASDASQQQINNAMPADNISYSVQLAEQTEFPDKYFDAITIAQALHWFQPERFAVEARRVLRPGGLIVAWVYGFFRVNPEIDAIFDAELKNPIDHLWKTGNHIAKSGYADLELPFEQIDVPALELICHWNLAELINYVSTWSALNRYIDTHGPEIIDQTTQQVATCWGPPENRHEVRMDFYVRGWRNEDGAR